MDKNINTLSFDELKNYYDNTLNLDKSTYKSSNDEPTPINCVLSMIDKIPNELWERDNLKILDPCCGNGNFALPIINKLKDKHSIKTILENILAFNDLNNKRLDNVKNIYDNKKYKLNILNEDFLLFDNNKKFDLIVANPPYAKFTDDGKRASKNHNLIKDFINKGLTLLKPKGYLLFITPDNWMSLADRNTLIEEITKLQIIHLDIHSAKKYFKKIGSSFTWYIIENTPSYKNINISGIWKKKEYNDIVISKERQYIPLLFNAIVDNILDKTIDNKKYTKFQVKTSSDLHHYTKKKFISKVKDDTYKYKLIHTPKQTVYANRPHKFQDGYKVFISTTDKYKVFIDECGMTQSIAFIICENKKEAENFKQILEHPLYIFINNICRYGNFNNIRILQKFPKPQITYKNAKQIYDYFELNDEEVKFIENNM
jgi:adenine-specific DNA-methyltransferase